jgi:hypothetical protein
MRRLGLILIAAGFLAGSLVAVLDPEIIEWPIFLACLAVGVVGVAASRWAIRRESHDTGVISANFAALDARLGSLVKSIEELDRSKADINPYDLPALIDRTFRDDLLAFADARESIRHAAGAGAYAAVMTPFAAAERYLNRVWSAAADGYVDEAHDYIGRAREQLADALAQLERVQRDQ